jgi:hypothetical protein
MLELKASVPRGTDMEIRVYEGVYYGIHVLDIRWYKDSNGKMSPTRKGVRMNIEEAKELNQVLNRILMTEEF